MNGSRPKLLLLLAIPMFMAACSSSGKLQVTQAPTETIQSNKTVAVSVEPDVAEPQPVHIDVANRIRAALFGRLVSDRVFKQVVHDTDPSYYKMEVALKGAREVSAGARFLLGVMAGANNLILDVTLHNRETGKLVAAFTVEGHSASHPFSSEAGLQDAVREAVDQIIATLGTARSTGTAAISPTGMTSAATTTSAITTSTARTQPSGDLASERAAWDAIRRSRNRADYDAFIAAFPAGQFAELARKRAAVPEGRVWDPVYYEPIEPGDRRRVESYFANRTRAAVSEVQRYNRKLNIYAPNRHEIKITSIQDFEVLDADPNGAIVKVIYMSGSLTWGTLDSHIYEAQWAANELRFTNHQKP